MELLQRIQIHFEQRGGTYLLVGTLLTAAYSVHSKWGSVAVLSFTVTAVGSYPYLRKQVNSLSNYALDVKVPALFSVVISIVTIFSPPVGLCLGTLMGASSLLRDWKVSRLLKTGEDEIKKLKDHNEQLEKTAGDMKSQVDALQIEFDKAIARGAKIEKSISMHLETQGIMEETDAKVENQFDRLEAKLQQLFSMEKLMQISEKVSAENIGFQVVQTADACHQLVQHMKSDREGMENLLATTEHILANLYSLREGQNS